MQECRREANQAFSGESPPLRGAAIIVVIIWLVAGALIALLLWRLWK